MPRNVDISSLESRFIQEALLQNLRIDGRAFDQFRSIDLEFGSGYGSASVRLGKTRIFTQISAEVTKPAEDRKFDGTFTINTELSPIASAAFETGRQTEQEVLLSRLLEKAIRRSNALDTESLCIVAGVKCWSIRADVHILDADGGLLDASCIAVMAALQHFRRPEVSVDGEQVTVHTMAERVPVPLSIMHHPVCVTFSFYHRGAVVLVDACYREEEVRDAEVTVTTNDFELCQIAKLGGEAIEAVSLLRCTTVALEKAREINAFIKTKLTEDATRRDVGGLIAELQAQNDR